MHTSISFFRFGLVEILCFSTGHPEPKAKDLGLGPAVTGRSGILRYSY